MTDRPILRLPNSRPAIRQPGAPRNPPRPQAGGNARARQGERFQRQFDRIDAALASEDGAFQLRADPGGIAPERALVFVTAGPVSQFARIAVNAGLEVISEIDLDDDFELPDDLVLADDDLANATLYATMPSQEAFTTLLRLWRAYQRGDGPEYGDQPWWDVFGLLAELRPWGPEDRLSADARDRLAEFLPLDDDEEVRLELEIWPTNNAERRVRWAQETRARVAALDGRVIHNSSIASTGFVYEALLVAMPALAVSDMIDNPAAPNSLATLEGLQFVLPQTIGQSLPNQSEPVEGGEGDSDPHDPELPNRAILLDGTPIAAHPDLRNGLSIEDVHDLVRLSQVNQRRHATSMASLILRGDLEGDNTPLSDSNLLSIPVLVDTDNGAQSPDDRLFVDVVHSALVAAFEGDAPLAPDAFVVNFSIGIRNSNFIGRISSLARLLDWWAYRAGVLFVVSAGNVSEPLALPGIRQIDFEDASIAERKDMLREAQRNLRHRRTLLAPGEALNVLTVGATSQDAVEQTGPPTPNTVDVQDVGEAFPALSSAIGLGPFKSIKPDLLNVGGLHDIRMAPGGNELRLHPVHETSRSGLSVAGASTGRRGRVRSRGTSCAAALTTRSILTAAAALTSEDGPYAGQELPRQDLALLTRALAVNAAQWSNQARAVYDAENTGRGAFTRAGEEVSRYYGHGILDQSMMSEAPARGVTLVGLGRIRKDQGVIFDMPLPESLSGDRVHRSMQVTLAWFSPVDPTRARYRLAALDAIAADRDDDENLEGEEDKGWALAMKGDAPASSILRRGTVWSRRLVHNRVTAPEYDEDAIIPIRVQCREGAGAGLDRDEHIPFAIAVTLQLAASARYDVHEEIEDIVRVRLRDRTS